MTDWRRISGCERKGRGSMSDAKLRTPQYWLAELDQYGNAKLIDGPHSGAKGCNKAAYLIKAMGLGSPDRKFAVAKVVLTECVPSSKGVNFEAVNAINEMRKR